MQESITMAVVGSIEKVSGSRIATPLGPPSPGSTPTKIPSTSPSSMSASVLPVSSTPNPCRRSPIASILNALISESCLERPLRHDDVESDFERDKHQDGEEKR